MALKGTSMPKIDKAGTFPLGGRSVKRFGYGAMQLAGPGVFGPPQDRGGAIAVLREAETLGINHIDTSNFYGPHVTNQIIREALSPYPEDLVTKIGAWRGEGGSWMSAMGADDLARAVEDTFPTYPRCCRPVSCWRPGRRSHAYFPIQTAIRRIS